MRLEIGYPPCGHFAARGSGSFGLYFTFSANVGGVSTVGDKAFKSLMNEDYVNSAIQFEEFFNWKNWVVPFIVLSIIFGILQYVNIGKIIKTIRKSFK